MACGVIMEINSCIGFVPARRIHYFAYPCENSVLEGFLFLLFSINFFKVAELAIHHAMPPPTNTDSDPGKLSDHFHFESLAIHIIAEVHAF